MYCVHVRRNLWFSVGPTCHVLTCHVLAGRTLPCSRRGLLVMFSRGAPRTCHFMTSLTGLALIRDQTGLENDGRALKVGGWMK